MRFFPFIFIYLFLTTVEHVGLSCDVSKEQEVQRVFDTITKTCGPVGYLVNAAGINRSERTPKCALFLVISAPYALQTRTVDAVP